MTYVIVLVLLLGVVLIVTSPLRRGTGSAGSLGVASGTADQDSGEREGDEALVATPDGTVHELATARLELEAARDAKYREIRDAELDHQTGKLSDDDFEAINSTLRAEAVELLRQLDQLDGTGSAAASENGSAAPAPDAAASE